MLKFHYATEDFVIHIVAIFGKKTKVIVTQNYENTHNKTLSVPEVRLFLHEIDSHLPETTLATRLLVCQVLRNAMLVAEGEKYARN